ncbi:MAG: hypothetical protein WCH31_09860 [Actinomycetes bacterium]
MRPLSPFARNLAILAGIALLIVVLNLERSLTTASLLVRFAFYLAIVFGIYLLWRDFGRREIEFWPTERQRVFYAAAGLLAVDAGWWVTTSLAGRDALVAILAAAACVTVGVRTWRGQHRYG